MYIYVMVITSIYARSMSMEIKMLRVEKLCVLGYLCVITNTGTGDDIKKNMIIALTYLIYARK